MCRLQHDWHGTIVCVIPLQEGVNTVKLEYKVAVEKEESEKHRLDHLCSLQLYFYFTHMVKCHFLT